MSAAGPRGRGRGGRRGRGRGAGRGAPRGDDNNDADTNTNTDTIDTTTETTTDAASNGHATKTTANRGGRRQPASKKTEGDDEENDKPKNKSDKKRSRKEMESDDVPAESKEDKIAAPPSKRTKFTKKSSNQIAILDLPHDVTEDDVADLLQGAEATAKQIRLIQETEGEPKTTACIIFEDTSKVDGIVSKLKSSSYKGKKLEVHFAPSSNPDARSDLSGTVSSLGITWMAEKVKLNDILAAIPQRCRREDNSEITLKGSKGICNRILKSVARLDFNNPADAKIAREKLNETEINVKGIKGNVVTVTFWASTGPRSKRNEQ